MISDARTPTGALRRIADGVEDPQEAAREALGKPQKSMRGWIVLVLWHDACSGSGWGRREHADKPYLCYSVGRVGLDGGDVLVLEANWHCGDGDLDTERAHSGTIAIPRESIQEIRQMRHS